MKPKTLFCQKIFGRFVFIEWGEQSWWIEDHHGYKNVLPFAVTSTRDKTGPNSVIRFILGRFMVSIIKMD